MELDTKSISILNKPRKTVTSPRLLTINHERQKPLFCPKTLARQALEPQVFRPESLRYVVSHTTQLSLLPIFRIPCLPKPAVSVPFFRDPRADSSIIKAIALVTLVNINSIRVYHTLHYFFLNSRYQLKQGLFNDYLSGQVKYPSITMTLTGGIDIAITLPVASLLCISK